MKFNIYQRLQEIAGDPPAAAFYGQASTYDNYQVGWPTGPQDKSASGSKKDLIVKDKSGNVIWKCTRGDSHNLSKDGKIKWHDNESIIRYLLQLGIL